MDIIEKISSIGVIPVVVIKDIETTGPLAQALLDGGLATMEITFRTDAAARAIRVVAKEFPSILLGAGTVLTVDQVKSAIENGASYIVSPGLNRAVVEYCTQNNICVFPGAITPTEIGTALAMGIHVIKFFPAEASGGRDFLKAVSAPYRDMKFIPTGGIDETNLVAYLRLPGVVACGGSWMVKSELVDNKRWAEITRLSAEAVQLRRSAAGS